MNHEEIIAMAREEGLSFVPDTNSPLVRIVRKAVAQLATCDAVVMLPGWSKSKGACIEHQLAVGLGLEIVEAGNV